MTQAIERTKAALPGIAIATLIAMASAFVSDHYGGPTLLYALLLGMALNYLYEVERNQAGIEFSAGFILRIGVALLGARITIEQILALGYQPLLLVFLGVPVTLLSGLLLARLFGQSRSFGILSGGSVAICGASAAMAIACVLPPSKAKDQQLVFTVIAVTALSTVAMIIYPLLTQAFGFDATKAGMFLGATIHDVAQVVGAGYLLGDEAGNTATFTKLLRVAMLVPIVIAINVFVSRSKTVRSKPPLLPWFLILFLIIIGLNSASLIPDQLQLRLIEASRWCLVIAIAAIGLKASLRRLATMGWAPLLMIVGETILLAILAWLILH